MANLAAALKDEIRRLARKEVRAQTGPTARAVARYRREIASLKRQIREQDKKITVLQSQERKSLVPAVAPANLNGSARFSARSVKAQRKRTGLSAADYARLVGVSALTIYNWEQGKSRPRKEQLASLIAIRGLGKRQAAAQLDQLTANAKSSEPKTRRVRRRRK